MSVDPAGNVMVSCSSQASGGKIGTSSSPTPTGPDTFTLSAPVTTITTGGTFTAAITRSGVPSTGPVGLNIAVIGACSSTAAANGGGGTITVQPTNAGPFNIPVVAGASAGTCTILYNIGYGGAVTSGTTQLNITVGASTTPTTPTGGTGGSGGVPTVSGCPTAAPGTAVYQFSASPGQRVDNNGFSNFVLPAGTIGAIQLPKTINGHSSGQVQATYSAYTASTQTLVEISISKCPGVIDTNGTYAAPQCYFSSFTSADATVDWMGKMVSGVSTVGKCMALESDGVPYYANIRYTYTQGGCPYGSGSGCGEMVQWNDRAP